MATGIESLTVFYLTLKYHFTNCLHKMLLMENLKDMGACDITLAV
jgi:hypothetical protein